MTATDRFDAIVVGSGISGGFAAKELTERGLRVLMLDRGHMVEHLDYPYDGRPPYEIPARDMLPARLAESDYEAAIMPRATRSSAFSRARWTKGCGVRRRMR